MVSIVLQDNVRSSVVAVGEGQSAVGDGGDAELEAVADAPATEVRTLWEAFSRFCRAEMGAEPETVLLAWVPPMQGWIEGALNSADGVRVDADLLLEYETALTYAWHEFVRDAWDARERVSREESAYLRQPKTVAEARQTFSPAEIARTLSEVKDALQSYETTALGDVAATLAEVAESLARTARELHAMNHEEWMTPDQAACHLNCPSTKAFQEIVAKERVPRHYVSERLPRYSRSELDDWLRAR
jgi:hypothetical protein